MAFFEFRDEMFVQPVQVKFQGFRVDGHFCGDRPVSQVDQGLHAGCAPGPGPDDLGNILEFVRGKGFTEHVFKGAFRFEEFHGPFRGDLDEMGLFSKVRGQVDFEASVEDVDALSFLSVPNIGQHAGAAVSQHFPGLEGDRAELNHAIEFELPVGIVFEGVLFLRGAEGSAWVRSPGISQNPLYRFLIGLFLNTA